MASQSPRPTFSHQRPTSQIYRISPYRGHNLNFGGQAQGYGHVPSSSTPNIDPYIRIAVLEKELEHCQVGKAEAEIAVQYLAILRAKDSAHGDNGDKKISALLATLSQANEESQALKVKLDNALAIFTSLMTSSNVTTNRQSSIDNERDLPKAAPYQSGDLIDLRASTGDISGIEGSFSTKLAEEGSSDDLSNDGDLTQQTALSEHSQGSVLSPSADFPDSSYIYHFAAKTSGPQGNADPARTAFKAIAHGTRGVDVTAMPLDQRSETSAEPRSDESSPEYAASIDGPASSTTSFVTANVEMPIEEEASAEVVPTFDVRTLPWHEWETVRSSPMKKAETSNVRSISEATTVCKRKHTISAFSKSSFGPALKEPVWEVSTLFHSSTQRENTVALHKREAGASEHSFPDLFKYGVRFEPDPNERDIYRTVLIRGIPVETKMKELLEKVRGGMVVDAKLLDTQKLTGSNTALIIFLHEHAALAYEEYAQTNPVVLNGRQAVVIALPTPTYPMPISLRRAIEDHQHTRCLEVHKFPRHVPETKLRADLRVYFSISGHRLQHMKMRNDGILELHFSAVNYAGKGFGMLTTFKLYNGCKTFFVADPCAQPVETLLQKPIAGPGAINIDGAITEASPEPNTFTVDQSAKSAKADWENDPEICRGSGFQTEDE